MLPMDERHFVILKYAGKTPLVAACEGCQLKFFVPMTLARDPVGAEEYLRQKYAEHYCRREEPSKAWKVHR
jgi:hypothetical protein